MRHDPWLRDGIQASDGPLATARANDLSPDARWFAVWTRSRQEKSSAAMLAKLGVENYLPLTSKMRVWSDRKQRVTFPLFSGYLFVRLDLLRDSKLTILKVPGIAGFVGNQTGPLPIPDDQIESIRTLLASKEVFTVEPTIRKGDRVRVIRGPMIGLEGLLVRSYSTAQLVICIEMIQKSILVSISPDDVEPVDDWTSKT